jgi:hypothetical protein
MSRTRLAVALAMVLSLSTASLAGAASRTAPPTNRPVNALITGAVSGLTTGHPTITLNVRSKQYRVTQLGIFLPGGIVLTPSATRAVNVTGTHTVGRLGPYLLVRLPAGSLQVHLVIKPAALHEGPVLTRNLRTQVRYVLLRFRITVHEGSAERTLHPLIKGT